MGCSRLGIVAATLLTPFLFGCSDARDQPARRLIGFDFFIHGDGTSETRLVTLDRPTLRVRGRVLPLGDLATGETDSAATSKTGQLSPDRTMLAVGGTTGEIMLVDPARLIRLGSIRVGRGRDVLVNVDSWPRRNRMLVVYGKIAVGNTTGDSFALVDPVAKAVVRRERLHGFVEYAAKQRDGTLVLLVSPLHSRPARILVISPEGRIRAVSLPTGHLPSRRIVVRGRYFRARRWPAFTTDGRGRAFVVQADQPVFEVDLRSLAIRSHRAGLRSPRLGLPLPPANGTGNAGPLFTLGRTVYWLGNGLIGIGGGTTYPVGLPGPEIGVRFVPQALQIVDTNTWRVVRMLPLTSCRWSFRIRLCSASVGGFPPDGKGSRASSLIAYDRDWKLLYRKRSTHLWWEPLAGRLLAGRADGTSISQLDPQTGVVKRRFGQLRIWPPTILDWRSR